MGLGLCAPEAEAGTRWRGSRVSVEVEPSLGQAVSRAEEVVRRAAARWSVVDGAPELEVSAARRETGPGYDPRGPTNSISFAPEGSQLVGEALAITLLTYDSDTLELLDADIIFNGRHRLVDVASCERDGGAPAYDFEGVLQHELGHVLGLEEDLEHPDAVMYPYASPWSVASRNLKTADETQLETLYSTPLPDAEPGCSARVAAGDRNIAVGNYLLVLGLFGLMALRRRKRSLVWVLPYTSLWLVLGGSQAALASDGAQPLRGPLAYLEVTHASARWVGGVLYTDLQLATRDCNGAVCDELPNQLTWVGGSRDGVVQVVGREPVPHVGAFLEVVAPPSTGGNRLKPSHYRTVIKTKGGDPLWIQ